MLKKTIKYEDFNGVEKSGDFYFNLTSAELTEMEMSMDGGYAERIQGIIDANDTKTLIGLFKNLILDSYGEKSADGQRFVKSKELSTAFSQTPAYSELFMELATDADAAADFVNGIIPDKVRQMSLAK